LVVRVHVELVAELAGHEVLFGGMRWGGGVEWGREGEVVWQGLGDERGGSWHCSRMVVLLPF
jgi:hypothetical protein